mgnify:CR=1 FL=1
MYRSKSFLCVIPARGGSKGLPDKNILPLAGKPLICRAIDTAKKSGIFDRIIISTDSEKIAALVRKHGLEVEYMQPPELATDKSVVRDVMINVLKWVKETDKQYDYVQLLECTSPLLTHQDIFRAAKMLTDKKADMVISVCQSHIPLGVSRPLGENLSLKGFLPKEIRNLNRQQIRDTYQLNSAIYIGKWDIFAEGKDFYEQEVFAYIMPEERSVHIDDQTDFAIAESYLKGKQWLKSILSR